MIRTIRGKKAERFAYAYGLAIRRGKTDLFDYYSNPSRAKVNMYNEIRSYALTHDFRDVAVIKGNNFRFIVAYRNNRELIVETKVNTYRIPIETTRLVHFINGYY